MKKHRVLEYLSNDFTDAFENAKSLLQKCFDCDELTKALTVFIHVSDPELRADSDQISSALRCFQRSLMANYDLFLEEATRAENNLLTNKDCLIAFGARDEKHDAILHLTSLIYAIRRFNILAERFYHEGKYTDYDMLLVSSMNTIVDYVDPDEGLLALELNPDYTEYVP